ncbi:MAG TPA: hypothetical protein VIC30_03935 [Orrella sp.]
MMNHNVRLDDVESSLDPVSNHQYRFSVFSRCLSLFAVVVFLSGCSTAVAVADAVGSAAVYTVKTVVNTVDAVTPDIVNGDDDDD